MEYLSSTFEALFLTPRNLIIIGMAWSLALMLGKILLEKWHKVYRAHVAPAILLVVCSVSVWIPGLRPGLPKGQDEIAQGTGISGEEIGWRIALGIILSVVAYAVPAIIMLYAEKKLSAKAVRTLRKVLL